MARVQYLSTVLADNAEKLGKLVSDISGLGDAIITDKIRQLILKGDEVTPFYIYGGDGSERHVSYETYFDYLEKFYFEGRFKVKATVRCKIVHQKADTYLESDVRSWYENSKNQHLYLNYDGTSVNIGTYVLTEEEYIQSWSGGGYPGEFEFTHNIDKVVDITLSKTTPITLGLKGCTVNFSGPGTTTATTNIVVENFELYGTEVYRYPIVI